MVKSEVAIIGLGITSKLAALAIATDVRRVTIFGEENPKIYKSNLVTFFSLNSIDFLKDLGFEDLVIQSTPINQISCSKLEKFQSENKFQINFKRKSKENEMGRVVINKNLNDVLDTQIKKNKNIFISHKVKVQNYENNGHNKTLILDNGTKTSINLLIIADKKSHLINKNFKNNIIKKELNQTSVVMDVNVETNNHAYQFFTKKGALALLPITKNFASIIWSLENDSSELCYNIEDISKDINKTFKNITNFIEITNLQKYKLNFEFAKKITSNSIVLIGDAAHSLHPIAGQGLNLSIKDILELKNKIEHFKYLGYPLGSSIILEEYENIRQSDNTIYTFATNYLDEVLKSRNHLVNTISNLGILTIEKNNFLKNMIIKSAIGQ